MVGPTFFARVPNPSEEAVRKLDRKLESTLGCNGESISPSFVSESRVGFFIRLVLENGGVVIFHDHDDDENAEQA